MTYSCFPGFLVIQTILFPSLLATGYFPIQRTAAARTIINLRKEYWPGRGPSQRPLIENMQDKKIPNELYRCKNFQCKTLFHILAFANMDLLCGECRARSDCTRVQSDLALHCPLDYHLFLW